MFCPNCAAKNSVEQKFCRSCGMNLEQTASSLSGQYGSDREIEATGWDRVFNAIGKFGFGGFCTVVVLGFFGLIYRVIEKLILSGTKPLTGLLLVMFIFFAALTLSWVIFSAYRAEKKLSPNAPPQTPELEPANTNRLTDGAHIPVPTSVTENTTNLLPVRDKSNEIQ
jgi:hypothetical protein